MFEPYWELKKMNNEPSKSTPTLAKPEQVPGKPWATSLEISSNTFGGTDYMGRILRTAYKANVDTVYVTILEGKYQEKIHARILRDYGLILHFFGKTPGLKLFLKMA